MANQHDQIYESPASAPDDDFWLEQGRKMVTESRPQLQEATKSLMTGLTALQGIYLAILGFAKFVPDDISLLAKFFFILPLLFWMFGLYFCLKVLKTERIEINLNSPDDIRKKSFELLEFKQRELDYGFGWMLAGVVTACLLIVFRLKM